MFTDAFVFARLGSRCRDAVRARQAETRALREQVFQLGEQVGKVRGQIHQVVLSAMEKQSQEKRGSRSGEKPSQ